MLLDNQFTVLGPVEGQWDLIATFALSVDASLGLRLV